MRNEIKEAKMAKEARALLQHVVNEVGPNAMLKYFKNKIQGKRFFFESVKTMKSESNVAISENCAEE